MLLFSQGFNFPRFMFCVERSIHLLVCPQFSPTVTKVLDDNNLTGNRRSELTRDNCSAIRVHTTYPTKAEREHVPFLLIRKYLFPKDAIGTGILSFHDKSSIILNVKWQSPEFSAFFGYSIPAAILVSLPGTPIWRFHTELFKSAKHFDV